ncbi:hypothetical protein BaOVIS_025440 [Babesia ovis]|uniref:CS domain-containing protein n=1 Tax=Babesia ovis TaxID=5869 RepID=A0A9W5WVK0_BABOV|nr:hypothetical protein BaOVIS_025440 [Babesia ovis]
MGTFVILELIQLLLIVHHCAIVVVFEIGSVNGFNGLRNRPLRAVFGKYSSYGLMATKDEKPQKTPREQAEEIVKKLEEDSMKRITEYLDPMTTAKIKDVDQSELEATFGQAYTPANIKAREKRNEEYDAIGEPDVPPTTLLPYFVNMQNPNRPLGDIETCLVETEEGNYDSELEDSNNNKVHTSGIDTDTNEVDTNGQDSNPSHDRAEEKQQDDLAVEEVKTNHLQRGLFDDDPGPFTGDPLDDLVFESDSDALEDSDDDGDNDIEEETGQSWYLDTPVDPLKPKDMSDGWTILPGGRIYKHLLKESYLSKEERKHPEPDSIVTFGFKLCNAFTNEVLVEASDIGGQGMVSPVCDMKPALAEMITSMVEGEQAEFICHIKDANILPTKKEEAEHVQWVRLWLRLFWMHKRGEKWWYISPIEASKYPKTKPSEDRLTRMERIQLKTEELKKQIEHELANNPCSPLWEDVVKRLSEQQKASVIEHFDRKYEMQERKKCAEYSGSRGFGENIKSTGQIMGYDIGMISGGASSCYVWHETHFMMYVAVPVVPGVRAEHVVLHLEPKHLTLEVAGKMIIDDDLKGEVEIDVPGTWAMSEKATEYEPLPSGHGELEDPVLKTSMDDEYHKIIKDPAIIIVLRKKEKATGGWGVPFERV